MEIDSTVPVAVIFRGGYGAVAIARTLGRLGVPMYLMAGEGLSSPVCASRFWTQRLSWDYSRSDADTVGFLLGAGATITARHGSRAILLSLADWDAIFIERNRAALRDRFVLPQTDGPIVEALLNKWKMHLLAADHGIPTPVTIHPASRDDAEEFVRGRGMPIVMKAADPSLADPPPTKVIESHEGLIEEIARREARHVPLNMVLQEYIPGGVDSVWMCNGYFGDRAEHTVTFTGQKLRQKSAAGVASLAVCVPNDTVAAQTRRFMQGVGYRGCVGIGYRYDRRDGLHKLLDVNARVSNVFRLFAGEKDVDVVRACYLDLTGQPVPETALCPGRKWLLEDDVAAAMRSIRRGRLTPAEWVRSLRGVEELHWLAADDPFPGVMWMRDRVRNVLARALGRWPGTDETSRC